jgi:hypothetical protein
VKKSTSLDSPVGSPLPAAPVSALGELLENLGNTNDCWIYGRLKICGKSFISDKPARGYMMVYGIHQPKIGLQELTANQPTNLGGLGFCFRN